MKLSVVEGGGENALLQPTKTKVCVCVFVSE